MAPSGVLAVLLNAAVAAHAATAVTRPVVRVLVRTEGTLAADPRTLGEIVKSASEIWRPYADVTFEMESQAVGSPRSLRLVITDRTSAFSDPASLGWIEFVDGRPSNVITVSTDAAMTLMKASRWNGLPKAAQRTFLVRAMARAIAHELGHYLLASREHARSGLMRGQLTADDIMQPGRSSTRLDRTEAEQLQRDTLLAAGERSPDAQNQ